MPFGLMNAPATFQATMNQIFAPFLHKFVIVFFDDILVYSASLAEHTEHLEWTLACLVFQQFFVKLLKCSFGLPQVDYLGHIVSAQGVHANPAKISAMVDWPTPTTIKHYVGS